MSTQLVTTDYPALCEEVVRLLLSGRQRAQQAVEREKAQTYWEVGRVLHAHVLTYKERAGYGEQVVARLAEDVKLNQRLIYQMLEVYRALPILNPGSKLPWTHYRRLSRIPAKAERRFYAQEAARAGWTIRELEERSIGLDAVDSASKSLIC